MVQIRSLLSLIALILAADCAPAHDPRALKQLEDAKIRFTDANQWRARRAELREGFLRGAQLWPLPEKPPLNRIVHERRTYADYSVENVALETMPGFFCTGNLYRPVGQRGPVPAILCPHGHFTLGRFRAEHQIRCAHLARMGAIVFSYGMVGWQDSQQTIHKDPLVLALQTWNSVCAVDFVSSLPDVDSKRIGITGASGGGSQALFLTLIDDRIAVSVPVVAVYPWSWFSRECACEVGLPVMRTPETNAVEYAACAAPRPQMIISCGLAKPGQTRKDATHDFPETGLPFIEHVYRQFGATDRLQNLYLAEEYHDYGPSKRKAAYAFLAKHLGLKRMEEVLNRITIESPETMSVFGEKHPLPERAVKGSQAVAEAFGKLRDGKGSK